MLALPWGSVEWIVWGEFVSLMGYLEGREGGREDDNVEGRGKGGMDWGKENRIRERMRQRQKVRV